MGRNVFVIGLGLIGGSLAMAIKDRHRTAVITGFDTDKNNVNLAKLLGIIDNSVESIEEGARNADFILLAIPVVETEKILKQLVDIPLKQDVIVTDAGSTKGTIHIAARRLIDKGITFIGGHPMAGSHKSGAGAAKLHLFENAFYLLVPPENIQDNKMTQLKEWLSGTKANFITVNPSTHDLLTGVVSHFPHIIAAGLVKQAENYSHDNPLITRLAAGGFRDITRIASSNPIMWHDILLNNKEVLLKLMNEWQCEMETIKNYIKSENSDEILRFFSEAKDFRDELPSSGKGAIPAFYDLYIDIPDYPGIVSEITGYLAQESISLTNIRILETREEIYGVLVVSFQTEADRKNAADCIANYTNYETILA